VQGCVGAAVGCPASLAVVGVLREAVQQLTPVQGGCGQTTGQQSDSNMTATGQGGVRGRGSGGAETSSVEGSRHACAAARHPQQLPVHMHACGGLSVTQTGCCLCGIEPMANASPNIQTTSTLSA
jgi:hypothetical protein